MNIPRTMAHHDLAQTFDYQDEAKIEVSTADSLVCFNNIEET